MRKQWTKLDVPRSYIDFELIYSEMTGYVLTGDYQKICYKDYEALTPSSAR